MRQIGMTIDPNRLLQPSRSTAPALPAKRPSVDRLCDITLPRLICWRPDSGPYELVRELAPAERGQLEMRREILDAGLRPFGDAEKPDLEAALGAMFSGFRMRQQGKAVMATIEITLAVLREFPSWAISEACLQIARGESALDEHWPPTDAEIYGVCDDLVRNWRRAQRTTIELLQAKVASREPLQKPTKAEIEAKIGRRIGERDERDTGYAARVAADLERRRQEREAAEPEPAQ